MINLDALCATYGSNIAGKANSGNKKDLETLCRNSTGVLQEEGVYAFFIYLNSKGNPESDNILQQITKLLQNKHTRIIPDRGNLFDNTVQSNLLTAMQDLNTLLYMLKIIMRTMTYALYGIRSIR